MLIKTYKIIILSLLLCSCATRIMYEECCVTDGIKHCSKADIKSRREFANGLHIMTCGTEFKAGTVKNGEPILRDILTDGVIDIIRKNTIGQIK